MNRQSETSWGKSAQWYDEFLSEQGTYQKDLILPNLLRLMEIKRGETVLDLACGQGFFSVEFAKAGAEVLGVDISKELVALANKNIGALALDQRRGIAFKVSSADKLDFIDSGSIDKIAIILAIQNMENVQMAFKECARVLKPAGRLFMVMTHPAFRVPKESSWGYDSSTSSGQAGGIIYRRIDRYLSELKSKIQMHPGDKPSEYTITFHRPMQFYFKSLSKAGFGVSRLEEWNSYKKSQPGPRAKAEDLARKEIPLFLFLEADKPE